MIASILVVDDDPEIRSMLKDVLEAKHHRVLEATDGAQAFAIAEKERPHLIIMDVVMGGIYGSTAVKNLRQYRGTAGIPIVLMSGSVEKSLLRGVIDEPSVRFLKKPFAAPALMKLIQELLPEGGYTR